MSQHLAVFFYRFGPYHLDRLRALRQQWTGDVTAIQESGIDQVNSWNESNERRVDTTLCPLTDSKNQPAPLIRHRLTRALDRFQPEVVAVPSWGARTTFFAAAWCLRNHRTCIIMNDSTVEDQPRKPHVEAIKTHALRCFDGALSAGRRSHDYFRRLGFPELRIRQGYDVVDNDFFWDNAETARRNPDDHRRKFGLPERYWLVCGRLIPVKDQHILLKAMHVSGNTIPNLVFSGSGPLQNELVELGRKYGLSSRLFFIGAQRYTDLPAIYALADLLVLCSRRETWGLVVNEALASGVPAIASDACGCSDDLLPEKWRFPVGDVDRLLQCAATAIRSTPKTCRNMVAAWGIERFGEGLLNLTQLGRKPRPFGERLQLTALAELMGFTLPDETV